MGAARLRNRNPELSGLEANAEMRIVEAIHKSDQVGKVVEIPELPRKLKPPFEQEIHRPGAHDKPRTDKLNSVFGGIRMI